MKISPSCPSQPRISYGLRKTTNHADTIARNLSFYSPARALRVTATQAKFNERLWGMHLVPEMPLYHLLSMRTYILKEVLAQDFISLGNAYKILLKSLSLDEDDIVDSWDYEHEKFIRQVIRYSPLNSNYLSFGKLLAAEFFLRKGIWGLYKYKQYEKFSSQLRLIGAPPYLKQEYAKTLWLEMCAQAPIMVSDNLIIGRLKYLASAGAYVSESYSVHGAIALEGEAIDLTMRAEMGHWLEHAGAEVLSGKNRYTIMELMDRNNAVNYSHKINHPKVVAIYSKLFRAYKELAEATTTSHESRAVIRKALRRTSQRGYKGYFVKNAIEGLKAAVRSARPVNNLALKVIGEGIFQALKTKKDFNMYEKHLTTETKILIEKIAKLRAAIKKLPLNVRTFFDGGFFYSNRDYFYPGISVPRHLILGKKSPEFSREHCHASAEWLDFLIRQKIGSLLIDNEINANEVLSLYRHIPIYLIYLYNQNVPLRSILEVAYDLKPGEVYQLFTGLTGNPSKVLLNQRVQDLYDDFCKRKISFANLFTRFIQEQNRFGPGKPGRDTLGRKIIAEQVLQPIHELQSKRRKLYKQTIDKNQILYRRAARELMLHGDKYILDVSNSDPVIWIYKLMTLSALRSKENNISIENM